MARTFSLLFAVGVGVPRSDALLEVAEEVVQWHAALWATRRVPVANMMTSRRTQRFITSGFVKTLMVLITNVT